MSATVAIVSVLGSKALAAVSGGPATHASGCVVGTARTFQNIYVGKEASCGKNTPLDLGVVQGPKGDTGAQGPSGVSGYQVFSTTQSFGPGGTGGGAKLNDVQINEGVAVAASYPNTSDPLNPGWNVQLNAPAGVSPGEVTVYAVCAKVAA